MRLILSFVLLLGFVSPASTAVGQSADLTLNGFVRTYLAARIQPDHEWLGLRARARLDVGYRYDRGRLYFALDALSAYVPMPQDGTASARLRLDEAYAEVFFDDVDLRLGKQRIVWGEADGVFITDLFSPLDLTRFTTQSYEDLRLAVPALHSVAYLGDLTLTGVWVLTYIPTLLPEQASPWFVAPETVEGVPLALQAPAPMPNRLDTGEWGARVQFDGLHVTTLSAIYGYVWNRLPSFQKTLITIPFLNLDLPIRVDVTPVTYRRHVAGLTATTAQLDPWIVRLESAYSSRRAFDLVVDAPASLTDPTAPDEPDRQAAFAAAREAGFLAYRPTFEGVLGVERGWGRHLIRLQAIGTWIVNHNDQIASDAFAPAFTALWNARFRRDTLTANALAFATPSGTYWLDAGTTWNVRDGLNATLGVQLFGGSDQPGTSSALGFGVYEANDFAYVRVQYDF